MHESGFLTPNRPIRLVQALTERKATKTIPKKSKGYNILLMIYSLCHAKPLNIPNPPQFFPVTYQVGIIDAFSILAQLCLVTPILK
jgi:hypothetical protein